MDLVEIRRLTDAQLKSKINEYALREKAGRDSDWTRISEQLVDEQQNRQLQRSVENIGTQIGDHQPDGEAWTGSFAEMFKSDAFLDFADAGVRGSARSFRGAVDSGLLYKAPIDVLAGAGEQSAGDILPGQVVSTARPFSFPLRVGSLFTQGSVSGSAALSLDLTDQEGGADVVIGVGVPKPDGAAMSVDIGSTAVRKIAATFTLPEDSLDDLPALEAEVRKMLLVGPGGVGEKQEQQYINGTGINSQLKGVLSLLPDEAVLGAGSRLSKAILGAATEIENETGFAANAVVINPLDAFGLRTEEDSENRPLWAGYSVNGQLPPLVTSRKLAQGTILVGAFQASTRAVRKAVSIVFDTAGLGLRDSNLVLVVAECREALVHTYGKSPFRTVTLAS